MCRRKEYYILNVKFCLKQHQQALNYCHFKFVFLQQSKFFFLKHWDFTTQKKNVSFKRHWETCLILHTLCIDHIRSCMFYNLCTLKINGFCTNNLLYEHEFLLRVWLWTLLKTVPESSWSIHMQPMTLRDQGENLLIYHVKNKWCYSQGEIILVQPFSFILEHILFNYIQAV